MRRMATVQEMAQEAAKVGRDLNRPHMLNPDGQALIEKHYILFAIGAGLIVAGLCKLFGLLMYTTP